MFASRKECHNFKNRKDEGFRNRRDLTVVINAENDLKPDSVWSYTCSLMVLVDMEGKYYKDCRYNFNSRLKAVLSASQPYSLNLYMNNNKEYIIILLATFFFFWLNLKFYLKLRLQLFKTRFWCQIYLCKILSRYIEHYSGAVRNAGKRLTKYPPTILISRQLYINVSITNK